MARHNFKIVPLKFKQEHGIVVPIVAVVAVLVTFILIGLGIDTYRVRQASARLSQRLDVACSAAASRATVQADAAALFAKVTNDTISSNSLNGAVLIGAKLILPTMPSLGDFCFYGDPTCQTAVSQPFISGNREFNTLLAPAFTCAFNCSQYGSACSNDCLFQGDVSLETEYPSTLWNNVQNAGNTVGCEATARVSTTFFGRSRDITAKATWWIPLRGNFKTEPGLTIAVAPEMTTRASDPRFRFIDNAAQPYNDLYPNFHPPGHLHSDYDPMWDFDPSGARLHFIDQSNVKTFPGGSDLVGPARINATMKSADSASDRTARAVPSGGYGTLLGCTGASGEIPGTNCLVTSDLEEMFAACMNPATLVRNMLISDIIEYSSRHGQLRMNTEFLMVPPQWREVAGGTDPQERQSRLNSPVEIVPYGSDLARPDYQIPFVFYHGGKAGQTPTEFGAPQDGFIDPFVGKPWDDTTGQTALRHRALIANQLRDCYHLFDGSAQGLKRIPLVRPGLDNQGFELFSDTNSNVPFFRLPNLRPANYGGGTEPWDQECPWAGAGCAPSKSRRLNAAEAASALGSVQKCPYEQGGIAGVDASRPFLDPNGLFSTSNTCAKPKPAFETSPWSAGGIVPATNDLRPDLLGLLYYLAGTSPAWSAISPAPFKAVASPGLFPINYNPADHYRAVNNFYPFLTPGGLDPYEAAINPGTSVVLITHQRLSNGEKNEIKRVMCPNDPATNPGGLDLFRGRPVTLIYIPTEEDMFDGSGNDLTTQAHWQSVEDFKEAFCIDPNAPSDARSARAIFVLSPYIAKFNKQQTGFYPGYPGNPPVWDSATMQPWQMYQQYWYYLLHDPNENIDVIAKNIFYSRILAEDIKF